MDEYESIMEILNFFVIHEGEQRGIETEADESELYSKLTSIIDEHKTLLKNGEERVSVDVSNRASESSFVLLDEGEIKAGSCSRFSLLFFATQNYAPRDYVKLRIAKNVLAETLEQ